MMQDTTCRDLWDNYLKSMGHDRAEEERQRNEWKKQRQMEKIAHRAWKNLCRDAWCSQTGHGVVLYTMFCAWRAFKIGLCLLCLETVMILTNPYVWKVIGKMLWYVVLFFGSIFISMLCTSAGAGRRRR